MTDAPKRKRKPKPLKKRLRAATQGPFAVGVLSRLAIGYLKLVVKSNKFIVEPDNAIELITPDQPVIVGVWHGQHILLPSLPIGLNGSAMISRNFDGEITARIVEHFGNKTIRASGGKSQKDTLRKGGITGFLDMLNTLKSGSNVIQTADIPRGISRQAGLGIIRLAQKSGRPIVPLAIASSKRYVFKKSWDNTAFNMPFGKTAICMGDLIHVPMDADNSQLENSRKILENEMNRMTTKAYALCGKPE